MDGRYRNNDRGTRTSFREAAFCHHADVPKVTKYKSEADISNEYCRRDFRPT